MLLLILPPIIVIVSFAFLLWYLTKKESDPEMQQFLQVSMDLGNNEQVISMKKFFWGSLEKMSRKSKVATLKFYNVLHDVAHEARTKKENAEKEIVGEGVEEMLMQSAPEPQARRAVPQTDMMRAPQKTESFVEKPISRKPANTEEESKPVVDKVEATPEAHEEDFIRAIAVNPKDFAAYEKLGDYYMDNGNIKDAKECYRQVLRLSPANRGVKVKIRKLEKLLG